MIPYKAKLGVKQQGQAYHSETWRTGLCTRFVLIFRLFSSSLKKRCFFSASFTEVRFTVLHFFLTWETAGNTRLYKMYQDIATKF